MIVGGAQENTLLTASGLDKHHWAVHILCGQQTGPEGSLHDDVRAADIPLFIEPALVRNVHPWKDFLAFARLIRFIRRGNYHVVHTHSSKAGMLGRWAAWWAGVPVIIHTVHGWGFHNHQPAWLRTLYILLERFTARVTRRVIVVANRDREKGLQQRIGTRKNYTTIRSAIQVESFAHPTHTREEFREEWTIPSATLVVGTVIRLAPQKNPLAFVDLARDIALQRPDTTFVMVGDGPLRSQVEADIKTLPQPERFIMTGLRRDIANVMHGLDVLALTSRWEGLPRVVPQAMAAGVPVVATSVGGCAEAITDSVTGFLVPPERSDLMVAKVLEILNNPEQAQHMSKEAYKVVLQEFTLQKMVQDIENVYKKELRLMHT